MQLFRLPVCLSLVIEAAQVATEIRSLNQIHDKRRYAHRHIHDFTGHSYFRVYYKLPAQILQIFANIALRIAEHYTVNK